MRKRRGKPHLCFIRWRLGVAWALAAAVAALLPAAGLGAHAYPRVGNLFPKDAQPEYAAALSRWDIVGLDASIQDVVPEMIGEIRSLNPEVAVLAYFPVAFIWADYNPAVPVHRDFGAKMEDADWWLYDDEGHRIGEPGNLWYLNLTTKCPPDSSGEILAVWLANYVADVVVGSGVWDGVILDGMDQVIRWLNDFDQFFQDPPAAVDCDRDGVADHPDSLDAWWSGGAEAFLATLRAAVGPAVVIVPNGNNYFYQYANGGIRENFPKMHGGWQQNMFAPYGYIPMCQNYLQDPINATMVLCYYKEGTQDIFTQPTGSSVEKFMRFTLSSALLGDGYYFFDGGRGGSIWWQDHYDLDLGDPLGPCYLDSIESQMDHVRYPAWRREFQNGTVICNPYQNYLVLEDGTWLFPEDGSVRTHRLPGPLGLALRKAGCDREFNQRDRSVFYEALVVNGNSSAAQGYVWADLAAGGQTVVAGAAHEIMVGVGDTDTLRFSLRVPASLPAGHYTLTVCAGGFDRVATDSDTINVTRIIEFDRNGQLVNDVNRTGCGGDSLVIYPQPLRLSGTAVLSVAPADPAPAGGACSMKLYDAAGRLVRALYEGSLDDGVDLAIGEDALADHRSPGIYFLRIETRRTVITRKIVLLR